MKYYSPLVRTIRSFLKIFLILTGFSEESQNVKVSFPVNILDSSKIEKLDIKLAPKTLQVYGAWLYLEVQLTGLRKFVFNYFYTSFFIGTIFIFSLEFFGICLYLLYLKNKHKNNLSITFIPDEWLNYSQKPESPAIEFPSDFSHILKQKAIKAPKELKFLHKIKEKLLKFK